MIDLTISDLHLTNRPEDSFRWEIFDDVQELQEQHSISNLYILGDLTDAKDKHSATLVNKIVSKFAGLSQSFETVHILMGNHDYRDRETPFFQFLGEIFDNVTFHARINVVNNVLFLPHTRTPLKDWEEAGIKKMCKDSEKDIRMVLLHQEVVNSVRENKTSTLEGIPSEYFMDWEDTLVFSGHMHVPQKVNNIIYVGSPYHTMYNAYPAYCPRVFLLDGRSGVKKILFLIKLEHFPCRYKFKIEEGRMPKVGRSLVENSFAKFEIQVEDGDRVSYGVLVDKCKQFCEDHTLSFEGASRVVKMSTIKNKRRLRARQTCQLLPQELLEKACQEQFRSSFASRLMKELLPHESTVT